ncbi:MAG: hypothetical protein GF403_09260 [Candidatus Coatesbacteria bacterium]|nr:hypothetical protein [Candidatus Coatesbacteria bacterium]
MQAEERKKILDMVVEGKISAEEAEKLMSAAEKAEATESGVGASNKFLIVKVHQGDNTNVNIRLPIGLAKIAKMFIPKDLEVNGKPLDIDFDEIIKLVETEVTGNIVEVHQVDEDTGTVTDVEIYLE